MTYDIEQTIDIAAAPEKVWLWVAGDVDRESTWRNVDGRGVQTLEHLDDGPVGVGSRFRGTVKVGPGKPQAYVNVVNEMIPARFIAWETTEAEGPLLGLGNYELEPTDEGTRFHLRLDYPPRTFLGRLQRPVVRVVGGRFMTRALEQLKTAVETDKSFEH